MEKTKINSRVYMVKSLTPWMMDELISMSRFQTFSLLLLRVPDDFYTKGLNQLKENGIEILVKPYKMNGLFKKLAVALKFAIRNRKRFLGKYNFVLGIKSLAWFMLLDMKLFSETSRMHAQFATQASIVSLLVKEFYNGRPEFAFTFHAYDIYFDSAWFSLLVENSTKAFSISDFNIDYVSKKFIRSEKIVLSRLGVFREEITPQKKMSGSFTLGLMSWFVEKKGISYLIEAMKIIRDQKGTDIQLLLAGDGPLRDNLESLAEQANLKEQVHFLGKMNNAQKPDFYASLDLFVLPSISLANDQDGIPVVLMEAVAYGLPIISTKVSGIPEICVDRYNGLLIEEKNAAELAKAIIELHADNDLRQNCALKASEISKEYDIVSNSRLKMEAMNW